MPEWRNILQENATPGDASIFALARFPTVESISNQSGKLRATAYRSAPCPRTILAAIATISAVVLLIFFCSRVFERRTIQDFRSRSLSSSEDSDQEIDVCGLSSEEEEEQEHPSPRLSLPSGEEQHLPLKKRLLTLPREADSRGAVRTPQQREQQQQRDEDVGAAFRSSPPGSTSGREQLGLSSLPDPTPQSSPQLRTPTELDAAAGLLDHRPHQRAAGRRASDTRRSVFVVLRKLQQQMGQLQQQMYMLQRQQRRGRRLQLQMRQFRKQMDLLRRQQPQRRELPSKGSHRQRQQDRLEQQKEQHDLYQERHHVVWEQQQQQQHFLQQQQQQPLLQEHMQQPLLQQQVHQHLMQQREQEQMLAVQEPEQVMRGDNEQQAMQGEEQQGPQQEERERQGERRKRKRKQQEEPEPSEEEQQQQLQPVDPLAGQSMVDEWIEPESPSPEVPQLSTSQQALQPPAAPAPPGPSRSESIPMQAIPGLAPGASDASRLLQALRDEDAAASAAGAATASAATALPSAETSSAASATSVEATHVGTPTMNSLTRPGIAGISPAAPARGARAAGRRRAAAGGRAEAAAGAAAGTGAAVDAAGAGSATPASAVHKLLGVPIIPIEAMLEHPFVRLPKAKLQMCPSPISVDLRRAVTSPIAMRFGVLLLQKAHELLSREVLVPDQIKELAGVVTEMIKHAVHYEGQDLSQHPTNRAVVRLGMRFLLLEAVLSAFLVLEQTPEEEPWGLLADAISHAAPDPGSRGNFTQRTTFLLTLCHELRRAMQILKTGRRPEPEDLMKVKWMLFCSPFSPARFRGPDFEAWRKQCDGGTDGP